jgi:hypothetical protein
MIQPFPLHDDGDDWCRQPTICKFGRDLVLLLNQRQAMRIVSAPEQDLLLEQDNIRCPAR